MIGVGKAINTILKDSKITNVYPIVADLGTKFPFIVYRRTGLNPSSSKDVFSYKFDNTIEIIIADTTYQSSVDLAEKVYSALLNKRGTFNNIEILDITLIDASEDYIEDTFIQKLIFKIEIK